MRTTCYSADVRPMGAIHIKGRLAAQRRKLRCLYTKDGPLRPDKLSFSGGHAGCKLTVFDILLKPLFRWLPSAPGC